MNNRTVWLVWIASGMLAAGVVDISHDADTPEDRAFIQVQAHDVVLIEATTGQRAVVEFTRVTSDAAEYRWRYRRSESSEALAGVGHVTERYERIPDGPDSVHVLPLPGHDTILRLGDIRAEWSIHDRESAFVYYHPKRAKVKLVAPNSFETGP